MRLVFIFLLIASTFCSTAQQDSVQQDTTYLSLEQVLKMTLAYHPVVKQADLINLDAEAGLRSARGNFDPKIDVGYSLKNFKETEYYDLLSTSFKIPTLIGIDPKIEFNRHEGDFVDSSDRIPPENNFEQMAVGVEIPIGRGLFFDERRNSLRQAEAFLQIAEAEQIKATNKILFTVVKDYWNWYMASQRQELLSQAIGLAQDLFRRTLIDFEYGEAAVVDTLQAKINYQKRIVDYGQAQLEYEIAKLNMAKHLWSEDLMPIELLPTVLPDSITLFTTPLDDDIKDDLEFAMTNHPELGKLQGKRNQLNADLRWARESLKPQVDLSYSLIDAPVNPEFETRSVEFGDNYKMGIDFSFPILMRKERGKLQQTRLKLQTNEFEIAQNQVEIRNDVLGAFAQANALNNLLAQYAGVSANFRRLLDAEIINLQNGEADLFRLNIQQDRYIDAQSDFVDAFTKWEKSKAEYYHTLGVPILGLSGVFGIVTN